MYGFVGLLLVGFKKNKYHELFFFQNTGSYITGAADLEIGK